MTEGPDTKSTETQEENFSELFEAYSAGMDDNIQVGDQIRGKVISVGAELIFVDTGTKIDGVAELKELLDEEGQTNIAPGDEITLYVVGVSESEIKLAKAFTGSGGLDDLRDAAENSIPIEGKVLEQIKGGFRVEIFKKKAFCPISQIDSTFVTKPEDYVGQTFQFVITKLEQRGRNIVVSRRNLLEKENAEKREQFFKTLQRGVTLEGKVTRLANFGAFVELVPGIEGMVHLSEISWSRSETLQNVVKPGDMVTVKVIEINEGKKKDQLRIALSIKQISDDPWTTIRDRIRVGDRLRGFVTNTTDFGAFIEIEPGIEGLVHISEFSHDRTYAKPEDIVQKGQDITVMVKDIDSEHRRLSLSMKDTVGDPWNDVEKRFAVGSAVSGRLEKKEKFGWFVNLEPGVTGLIPQSSLRENKQSKNLQGLRPGSVIAVTIAEISAKDRKITLSVGDYEGESNWQSYLDAPEGSLGILGSKLKAALEAKNSEK